MGTKRRERDWGKVSAGLKAAMAEVGETVELKAGDVLFRKGEPGQAMYLLESGDLELLFEEGKEGKVIGAGQAFGELALLVPDLPRTATAVAATDLRLSALSRRGAAELESRRPDLVCALLRTTCEQLVASERSLLVDLRSRNRELERTVDFLQRTRDALDAQELLANTDELTGLYNRRCLGEQFEGRAQRAAGEGLDLSILLIDLDKFKPINDTHGHAAGDVVLKRVADLMRESARSNADLPCRVGGDEFAILWCGLPEANAIERSGALRQLVADTPIRLPEVRLSVTITVGGALWKPGDDLDDLMHQADESLYLAKEAGRNRLCWMGRLLPAEEVAGG